MQKQLRLRFSKRLEDRRVLGLSEPIRPNWVSDKLPTGRPPSCFRALFHSPHHSLYLPGIGPHQVVVHYGCYMNSGCGFKECCAAAECGPHVKRLRNRPSIPCVCSTNSASKLTLVLILVRRFQSELDSCEDGAVCRRQPLPQLSCANEIRWTLHVQLLVTFVNALRAKDKADRR